MDGGTCQDEDSQEPDLCGIELISGAEGFLEGLS